MKIRSLGYRQTVALESISKSLERITQALESVQEVEAYVENPNVYSESHYHYPGRVPPSTFTMDHSWDR